jgi:hypothetical protein
MNRLLIISFILFSVSWARADYHYVSHTGSDIYPYTSWATAADSVQPAINAASPGDTVYVGAGVWEDAPYTLWADLALIGRGIDSTTIRHSYTPSRLRFITTQSRVHIEGLTFDGVNRIYNNCAIEAVYHATDIDVFDNEFVNLNTGILFGGNSGQVVNNKFLDSQGPIDGTFSPCSLLVENNTFVGNTDDGIVAYDGDWFIQNNLFHHNPDASLVLLVVNVAWLGDTAYVANNFIYHNYEDEDWAGKDVINCGERAYLENNTIVEGPWPIRHVGVLITSSDSLLDLKNNIIANFSVAVRPEYTYTVARLAYNDLWANTQDAWGPGRIEYHEGNIHADPMFADTTDFHLQAYSPCIDAGDPNIIDVDGTRSDIGVFGGPDGSSYVYQDLPPLTPDSIAYRIWNDTIYLDWRDNYEADFAGYQLHREIFSGFTPSPANLIAEPEGSSFADGNVIEGQTYYYRMASLDNQGNLSEYSPEMAVMATGVLEGAVIPRMTVIVGNYPNPFNQQTIISYHLADVGYQPAEVKLTICDIGGRLIKTLVNQRQHPGDYRISWDGRDEGGEAVSSGVYFSRLIVSDLELSRPRKITLLR